MSVIGFDFGNSSGNVAAAQKGGVDVLMNEVSSRQTPSMVAFGEKERYLGDAALTQHLRNIKNTVTDVKRFLGRKFNDPTVQQEMKTLPLNFVELPNNEIGVQVFYQGEQKTFSLISIAAMELQKLKDVAEKATTRPCVDVVISVPGYWSDQQRRAMLDASKIANLNCLRLLNETTATAIGYGIYKKDLSDTEPLRVCFVDVGQSTTSVSIVEFLKGKLKVISTAYDQDLGGRNFDLLLAEHFAKEFQTKFKIDARSNMKAWIRVVQASEKLKKMLNANPEAPISIDSLLEDVDVKGMMKKEDFFKMCDPLAERVLDPIRRALADAKLTVEQINQVEVTGGASRSVPIRNKVQEFFKQEARQTMNSEESVVRGCALQCAILSPLFKVREYSITDLNPYPIKVSWKSLKSGAVATADDNVEIFGKNNQVPSSKHVTFNRTEGFVLTAEYSQPELIPKGTPVQIASFTAAEVPTKEGQPAKVRVRVKLDLNSCVSVEEVQTLADVEEKESSTPTTTAATTSPAPENPADKMEEDKPATPQTEAKKEEGKKEEEKKKKVKRTEVKFTSSNASLPIDQLNQLVESEAQMMAADRLAAETADRKNHVESYVYEMRGKISDSLASFATDAEREKLSKLLEDTESWLYGEGEDVSKSEYVKRLDEMKALGEPISRRKYEDENRYEAVSGLRAALDQWNMVATSVEPQYDHITQEEKDKVTANTKTIEKWLNESIQKQDASAKTDDVKVTVAELQKKKAELERFSAGIMNKPKPKPKPEEKKEEKKEEAPKTEEKKEEKKEETPAAETAAPKTTEMDLD